MKKFLSVFLSVIILVCSCFIVGSFMLKPAFAETPALEEDPTEITNSLANSGYFDKALYSILSRIYTEEYGKTLSIKTGFPVDAFKDEDELDLTIGSKATINALKTLPETTVIQSLTGLDYLNLSKLKTLKINGHNIKEIFEDDLSSLSALEKLTITNCNLENIMFPTQMLSLNNLDLSNNKLTEIDVSLLNDKGEIKPTCNLSGNKFSKVEDIVFSSEKILANLNVSYNQLIGVKATDFTAEQTSILLQGYRPGDDIVYGQEIYTQGDVTYPALSIKVFFNTTSDYYESNPSAIAQTNNNGVVKVPCGKIVLKFYNGNVEITDNANFAAVEEDVLPPTPVVKVYVKDKEVTTYSHNDPITLKADLGLTGTAIDSFIAAHAETKIKVGAKGQYKQATEMEFTAGGDYAVTTVVTFDGLESKTVLLNLTKNDMSGFSWFLIVIVIIFVAVVSSIFMVRWFKNGAVVAPLTEKETRNLYRKQGLEYVRPTMEENPEEGGTAGEENIETPDNNDDDNEVIGV